MLTWRLLAHTRMGMPSVQNLREDNNNPSNTTDIDIAVGDIDNQEITSFWGTVQNILGLSLPMAFSYTFSFQMVLLIYLLSRLDEDEDNIAATTLISTFINTIILIGISPLFAMSMVAGNEIGELHDAERNNEDQTLLEEKRNHIAGINRNGLLASLIIIPPMVTSMVFSQSILQHLFNQDETVSRITQDFVRPYAIIVPAAMLRMCSEQVMFGFGKTKPAMLIALTSFVSSMSLGGLLAFGRAGLPRLGKTGVLVGCMSDAYLTALGFSLYIAKSPDFKAFKFFNVSKPFGHHTDQLKKIIRLGTSFLFSISTETLLALATSVIAGRVGTEEQEAFSNAMLFALLLLLFETAFGQSCAQEMSRKLGEKHFDAVSRVGKIGLLTTLGFAIPIPLILSINPNILMSILGENKEATQEILHYLVPIIATGCISDAVRFNLLQQLRALGDTHTASIVSAGAFSVGVSLSALLGLKTNMGISGVATGYTSGIALATAGLFYRWHSRITPDAIRKQEENPNIRETAGNGCFAAFFKSIHRPRPEPVRYIELQERLLKTEDPSETVASVSEHQNSFV